MVEKLLPQNIEAETGVLGSIIIDPAALDEVIRFLRPSDFYRDAHRQIYESVVRVSRTGTPADFITLCDDLERRGKLADVGGASYLTSLIDGVPTSGNVEYYGRIVERCSLLRRLIHAAGKIAALAYEYEEPDVAGAFSQAEKLIFDLTQRYLMGSRTDISMEELMVEYMKLLEDRYQHRGLIVGVPTGYADLDRLLGGFHRSDLVILAARPSVGKTQFSLNLARNAAKFQFPVGFFSLEMSKEQLAQRFMAMQSKIEQQRLRTGWIEDDEWPVLVEAADELAEMKMYIDDTPAMSLLQMRSRAREWVLERGARMLVIDYLQLMTLGGENRRHENRVQEVSAISRGLKALARELNVPVIALSQLSRDLEKRQDKKPQLSDLRESGCLAGNTLVYLPDEGVYQRIDALLDKNTFRVLALNEATYTLEPRVVTRAFPTGRKLVYTLKTRLGQTIRATSNHQFLTIEGWKRLEDLALREHIALPRHLQGPLQSTMSDAELALLGHLIGDGCTLPRHAIQYTTADHDLAEMVVELASQIFGERVAPRIHWEKPQARDGGWYQVYLPASYRLARGKRNPIVEWLQEMGVHGLRSYEKYIPQRVFAQSAKGIALFLRHLWVTDGTAFHSEGRQRPTISFATSSPRLATEIQSLLLRLHILSRVSCVPQPNKGRHQYHVDISGKANQERFIHLVGMVGERKRGLLDQVRLHLSTRTGNTNLDILPRQVWRQVVVPAMAATGMTARQMYARIDTAYAGTGIYKQGMGRERALRVATAVQSRQLRVLSQSDVYWDEVVSIEPDGEEKVYDLTVEEHHNFVANNILVHNSLEQDADVVMFIYRDEVYNEETERKNIADILVSKQRNGPVGEVSLYFELAKGLFRTLEASPIED